MKKWKKYLMLSLLVCLALTGCGKGKEEKTDEKTEEADVVKDAVFMAVGGETVYGKEAMSYLYLLKRQYETSLGEGVWSLGIEEGESFSDYAKEAAITNLTQLKIICQQAKKEGISLDEEELYEAGKTARELLEAASEEDREKFGLTEEILTGIYADNTLAAKFFDVTTGEVDTNISDEEARQVTIQYASVLTEGLDEEHKKKAKKEAKKLLSDAKEASSFLNFASSNSDSETVELTFGKEDMPEEFGAEAMGMKTGEISPLIEGKKGYYILYCISDFNEDATTAKKEALIDERRDKLFREKYKEWSKDYKVVVSTALWEEASFTQENTALEQN